MGIADSSPSFAYLGKEELRRDGMIIALAVLSGLVDAFGFLGLGGSFSSVMTGNIVLFGVSSVQRDGALTVRVGVAILSYVAGSAIGAHVAGQPQRDDLTWPEPVTRALLFEFAALAATCAAWVATNGRPAQSVQVGLLALTATGLGVQSAAILRLGVSGLSTTYLTGTLTTLVTNLVAGTPVRTARSSVLILIGLVAGATSTTALLAYARQVAPLAQIMVLAVVISAALKGQVARRELEAP